LDTYFWINIKALDGLHIRLGPYLTLAIAAEILLDHLPTLQPVICPTGYEAASITEEALTGQTWEHIVEWNHVPNLHL
jgi:hypothetical protein